MLLYKINAFSVPDLLIPATFGPIPPLEAGGGRAADLGGSAAASATGFSTWSRIHSALFRKKNNLEILLGHLRFHFLHCTVPSPLSLGKSLGIQKSNRCRSRTQNAARAKIDIKSLT